MHLAKRKKVDKNEEVQKKLSWIYHWNSIIIVIQQTR